MKLDLKKGTLGALVAVSLAVLLWMEPVSQDPGYHRFADQRTLFGVPNFWNVMTNLPMVVVGLLGAGRIVRGRAARYLPELAFVYMAFFCGLFLTGLGSAYYHIEPDNASLLFDRLPMTVLFVSFFCIVWGEHISSAAVQWILWPLLPAGLATVIYWYWTETLGRGDLRPYALVQFLPMLLIPLILLLYQSKLTRVVWLWGVLAAYGVSKLAEVLDQPIYDLFGVFSGHSIKHLIAALAAYLLYLAIGRLKAH
ncbi:MAG: ceramidase domain-containing protein [Desulfobacteraceae bacterium]|jgi:hypothetical protein